MKFAVVNPFTRTIEEIEADQLRDVEERIAIGRVDHGSLSRPRENPPTPGLGYCVYEYALFADPAEQRYFAIRGRLMAGKAIFYGYDFEGETVDCPASRIDGQVTFFQSIDEIEAQIMFGTLVRPEMRVNGQCLWSWPRPIDDPKEFIRSAVRGGR